jgi:hypothetical protein
VSRPGDVQIVVLVDGLGWWYADRFDFLADLLPYRAPLKTVLGYSSGAIPSILTGRPPAEHGHWNLFYYDPEGSPFRWLTPFRVFPDALLDNRVTRKILKETGRRLLGLGTLFDCCMSPRHLPWFNWVEKRNIYEEGGIVGAPSIFARLRAEGVPYRVYTYHRLTDAEILRQARVDVEAGAARFYFLYLSQIDAFLHQHCEDQDLIGHRLRVYGDGLRQVVAAARRRDPHAGLTLTSDHGMTPVRRMHDLAADLAPLSLRLGRDYLAVYDSTMARFWLNSDRALARIPDRLAELRCGRLLDGAELKALGLDFPDRRYGDLVFLMHSGSLIGNSGFNNDRWRPTGMHGYHPDDPTSDAVLLTSEPPASPVRTIMDTYAVMLRTVGLDPQPKETISR